jgi:hypothetical protein
MDALADGKTVLTFLAVSLFLGLVTFYSGKNTTLRTDLVVSKNFSYFKSEKSLIVYLKDTDNYLILRDNIKLYNNIDTVKSINYSQDINVFGQKINEPKILY